MILTYLIYFPPFPMPLNINEVDASLVKRSEQETKLRKRSNKNYKTST